MEMNRRGYCGIGIVGTKTVSNVGTLWRSAAILGASFIFTAGKRFPKQASDTLKTWKYVPMYEYESPEVLFSTLPVDCIPVAVELDENARPLAGYRHPERAIYILGAEDHGLSADVLKQCSATIVIPGDRSLNVAVAGSIVLYDRLVKAMSR